MDFDNLDDFLKVCILILIYTFSLFIAKFIGFWKKISKNGCVNCCPKCSEPLERIRRKKTDYILNYLTFQIFDFKRYKCLNCSWNGVRWETPYRGEGV